MQLDPTNNLFDYTFKDRVVGANESFDASKSGKKIGCSGVKVINDSVLFHKINSPDPSFMNIFSNALRIRLCAGSFS